MSEVVDLYYGNKEDKKGSMCGAVEDSAFFKKLLSSLLILAEQGESESISDMSRFSTVCLNSFANNALEGSIAFL